MIVNLIKPGTARLERSYRCWSIRMEGELLERFITEGSWCFLGEAQTLVQVLNRMDAAEVNRFVDGGDLEQYVKTRMVRGPGKNKRARRFHAW
jgi:hypothetical protein